MAAGRLEEGFGEEAEGMPREFGGLESGRAGIVLSVDDGKRGVVAQSVGGEKMGYGFARSGNSVVGFFNVDMEGVAFDFADGECGYFIAGVYFKNCAAKVWGEVGPVEEHTRYGDMFGAPGG